jgi:O26-antigen biosynthesis N-acetyl-L-fucosamine transferase
LTDVLILLDDHLPASTKIHAKMYHQLAKEITKCGLEVAILVPGGALQRQWIKEIQYDGVNYWQFKSPIIRSKFKALRLIFECLLPIMSILSLTISRRLSGIRIVINHSPTIFYGLTSKYIKRKVGAYIYLIQRDFFPMWAIDKGLLKPDGYITRFLKMIEQINYQSSDKIALQSDKNAAFFQSLYPQYRNRCEVLYNWTKVKPRVKSESNGLRFISDLGIEDKIIFFYGGTMGHPQNLVNILKLAEKIQNINSNVHFLLVGSGHEYDHLTKYADSNDLKNVTIHQAVDQLLYSQILMNVQVGIISLDGSHRAHNYPGKLLGYMEAKLPILGSVNLGNDVIDLFNKNSAGFLSVNGDHDQLVSDTILLAADVEMRKKMGNNAFLMIDRIFSVKLAAAKILSNI